MINISNITAMLKGHLSGLSAKERKIAEYAIQNPEKLIFMSVSDLSSEVGTAQSTIVRMCKNLGFKGFTDFKLSLAKNSDKTPDFLVPEVKGDDSAADIFAKVVSCGIESLRDTLSLMDMQNFQNAVQILNNAENIVFLGVGSSAPIAQDIYYRFMRIGCKTVYSPDSHMMHVNASKCTSRDTVIAISYSGETIATIEMVRTAISNGATVICVTSKPKSTLAKICHIPLIVYSDETNYKMETVSTRLTQLTVCDALCVAVSVMSGERTKKHTDILNSLLAKFRYK